MNSVNGSKKCHRYVKECILSHYPETGEEIYNQVNSLFSSYLDELPKEWQSDKNFHNKQGGTFDCILLLALYKVCQDKVSVEEIEKINNDLLLPSFKKISFLNYNWKIMKPLMHKVFVKSKKRCDKFHDFVMNVDEYSKDKPLTYNFTYCPIADFAKKHGLEKAMPALCNGDYYAMRLLHARLIRKHNCVTDEVCDYTLIGDKDRSMDEQEEYVDELGYIRNK